MYRRSRSIGRIVAVVLFSLVCFTYSHANNSLSGSGALPMAFWFGSAGSTCSGNFPPTCSNGTILGFGPDSLNGAIFSFSDSFSSYSETPLPSGLAGVSATVGSGYIAFGIGNYSFTGQIYAGSMDGSYCTPFNPACCCQHINGLMETTVYFSGKWMIPHYPTPDFWPAQGHFYLAEEHAYSHWVNCDFPFSGCGKPPSTIWIDTQIPGSTPEPNTLVLLGSGVVALADVLRRKVSES